LEAVATIPVLSDEAQEKLMDSVKFFANSDRNGKWSIDILGNINNSAKGGIDNIGEVARGQYINFLGNTASNILSMEAEDQTRFQEAAIRTMQKTQFPYKFDRDSFREALSVVPANVRTQAYPAQLEKFDKNLEADRFGEEGDGKDFEFVTEREEPVKGYKTSNNPALGVPIEIIPPALPIVPEGNKRLEREEYDIREEELVNDLAEAQAE
jgi:hypothetical protein